MGRTLTLRGELTPFSAETPLQNQQIFAYESAGQKRAWKVTEWAVWPMNLGDGESWTFSTFIQHRFILATDTGPRPYAPLASENRTIGWINYTSEVGKECLHFSPVYSEVKLDPDHLVTGQLFIGGDTLVKPADNDLESTWNYMIKLESRTITPAESIMQTLKGRGQDVAT